jgi:hypothetical protein
MKKIYFSIGLMLLSLLAFSQWTWQNPIPQGNTLKSVQFPDANTGYAVSRDGIVLKTINGGETWVNVPSGTINWLNSVYMTNSNTGCAVGMSGTILRTSPPPTLSVNPPDITVSAMAGSTHFSVTSNTNWTVFSDASWCNVTPSGSGNDSIITTYSENTTSSSRIANIIVRVAGLDSISVTVTQSRSTIGLENTRKDDFNTYPNPNNGHFRIVPGSYIKDLKEVTIQDLQGKVILRRQLHGEKEYIIDLSTVSQGFYHVILKSCNQIEVRKLIIIR